MVKHRYLFVLLVCLLFVWLFKPNFSVLPYTSAILLSGFVLFAFGILGAGDTKLLAVLSLGVKPSLMPLLIYGTLVLGCLLAFIFLIYGKFSKVSAIERKGIPYAIPISIAGWACIALSYMDWFDVNF